MTASRILAITDNSGQDVALLLNQGGGVFANETTWAVGAQPQRVVAGDFNGDGRPDVAAANFQGNTVSVLLNLGDGNGFGGLRPQATFAVISNPTSIDVGDFSGDGHADLAVVNESGASVSILLGAGNGGFAPQIPYATGPGPWSVAVADFNQDGVLDLAVTNYSSGTLGDTVSILLGTGGGTFGSQTTFASGLGPVSVAAGDFNEDGLPDLAIANASSASAFNGGSTVSILLNLDGGTFGSPTPFTVGQQPELVAVADLNGDGHLDLAVANYVDNTVSVLLGTGLGTFSAQTTVHVQLGPQAVAVADFNEDGHPDLAVANWGSGISHTVSVLLGLGDGGFGPQTAFTVGVGPTAVAAADLNGDGHADLAVANYGANGNGNTISVLLGLGDGGFGGQTTFAVGSAPWAVAVGDFNGDGRPDLAVANDDALGTVSILLGVCQ